MFITERAAIAFSQVAKLWNETDLNVNSSSGTYWLYGLR